MTVLRVITPGWTGGKKGKKNRIGSFEETWSSSEEEEEEEGGRWGRWRGENGEGEVGLLGVDILVTFSSHMTWKIQQECAETMCSTPQNTKTTKQKYFSTKILKLPKLQPEAFSLRHHNQSAPF